jgi:hypothetical protein
VARRRFISRAGVVPDWGTTPRPKRRFGGFATFKKTLPKLFTFILAGIWPGWLSSGLLQSQQLIA